MRSTETPHGEVTMYDESDKVHCPMCGKLAVVPLTPKQLREQPDDTTHVCHPAFGGCNQGFAV